MSNVYGDWGDDDNWDTTPQYPTKVYTKTSDNARPNWRDNSQRKYNDRQGPREDRRDGYRGGEDRRDGFRGGEDRRDGFRGGNRGGGPKRAENEDTQFIKVPSRFVGRIIGKGGVKINDLQFESGARINVTKDTDGDETVIKISGSADAISKAESLIRDLTVEREAPKMFEQPKEYEPAEEDQLVKSEQPVKSWREVFAKCDEMEAAMWASLPEIQKQFYTEHPEVTAMTDEEVATFREASNNIVVERTFKNKESKPIPKPVVKFEHAFHQYPEILNEIEKAGFTQPSPIQSQAWPVLLSGEDLIGIAQTGTGKTLAFLLPAMVHIDGQLISKSERTGPAVLVMAPTRELALQIDKEVKKYEYKGITALCVYGGGNRREQIKTLTEGVDIVIATPGRLNDLIEARHLEIKYVTYVVLDEADRMLDMGFEPQIRKVMYSIRPTRQTVMTSATWPMGVRRLAQSYMVDPIQIYVGTLDLAATHTVTQVIEMLPDDDQVKYKTFMDFVLNLDSHEKIIVFCGKKARADDLASELVLAGINCQSIHGDRDQADREQALLDIQDGTVQILIATDVASRGLDIDDITHVINYDFPRNIEEYVHRVGRTGRAGKSGMSISYFTRGDWAQAKELISILDEAQQYVPEELYGMAERHGVWKEKKDASRPRGGHRGGGGGGNRRW